MNLEEVQDTGITMGEEHSGEEGQRSLEHREDPTPLLELKEGERPGEERGGLGCIQSIQSLSSVLQLSWADPDGEQRSPKRTLQHWECKLIKSQDAEYLFKCV